MTAGLPVRQGDTAPDFRCTITGGSVSISGIAGTEYVEDSAAVANPSGGVLQLRRRDTLSSETSTDGDITTANGTAKGEIYVKHVDALPVTGTFWQATQPVSIA